MEKLHEIINGLFYSRGLWNEFQVSKLIHNWGIMVGDPLSTVTRAIDYNRGRLRVIVSDPVWGHHLSLMKPQIIKKLNTHLGKVLVKDIYFQVGEIATGPEREQQANEEPNRRLEEKGREFKKNLKRLLELTLSR